MSSKNSKVSYALVYKADGVTVDVEESRKVADEAFNAAVAAASISFDEVAGPIYAYLLRNKALRSVPIGNLINAAYNHFLRENPDADDDSMTAQRSRLEEVVPAYIKSEPDLFYFGRGRGGVVISHLEGETNDKGEQIFRTDPKEFADLVSGAEERKAKREAEKAAKDKAPNSSAQA